MYTLTLEIVQAAGGNPLFGRKGTIPDQTVLPCICKAYLYGIGARHERPCDIDFPWRRPCHPAVVPIDIHMDETSLDLTYAESPEPAGFLFIQSHRLGGNDSTREMLHIVVTVKSQVMEIFPYTRRWRYGCKCLVITESHGPRPIQSASGDSCGGCFFSLSTGIEHHKRGPVLRETEMYQGTSVS